MEFDVFISHSSKDKTMADAVCAKLEQAGIRCWIAPRDIQPGMTWSGEIMKAIEKCKVMVLVFSSNANESVQIVREVESAVHRGKPILPLRIEDIQPSDSMAFFMNSVHWLDAISEPHERYLDQLVQAVAALLGSGITPKVAPDKKDKGVPDKKNKPGLDLTPIGYAVVVVVVLGVLLGVVMKLTARSSSVATNPVGGSIDPSMTGVWYFKTAIVNLPALMTAEYDPNGAYKIETVISDSGTYEAGGGNWTTKNAAGTVQQGTYSYAGPHTLRMTGPLGTAQWTEDSSAPTLDPNNPNGVGTWQATTNPPNSPPWNMTLINRPDGTYSSTVELIDQGNFTSVNGRMTLSSHTTGAIAVPATYNPAGQDSMEFTGPAGPATWSRKKP